MEVGNVILAHPNPDTLLEKCQLLEIHEFFEEFILASPLQGEGLVQIPYDDVRMYGTEEKINKEEKGEGNN